MVITAQDTKIKPGYKQTEVGVIPEDWEVDNLKRFWVVIDCKHLTAKFVESGIPVASIREVQSRFVVLENAKQTTQFYYLALIEGGRKPQPGDLIFSRNATVGEIAQVAEWHPPFAMGQDVCLLRKKHSGFSSDYLQAVVRSPTVVKQFANFMVGSTFKRVNVKQIQDLIVPMPLPEEQQAIATALSDVDALITSLDKLIAKKRDIKQAAMQQLLTGKRRLPGFSGEWKVEILGKIAETIDPHPSHRAPAESNNGIPFVGIGDISTDGKINHQTARIVNEMIFEQHNERYRLDDGLIGIGRVASIGKVVRLLSNVGKFVVSPTIAVIKPKKIDSDFLFYYLTSKEVKERFDRISNGSTRQSVGMNVLRDIQLFIPKSLLEQAAIATILSDMDAEIAALEQKRDKTRALKQGMMQELLTGKTRLVAP